MKKILIYMYNMAGGGAERTIVNIANKLVKNSYDIVLVIGSSNNNDYLSLLSNEVQIIELNVNKRRKVIFKLARVIRNEKPNLIFSTINKNNITLLISKIFAFKKIPTIVREANNRTESGDVTKLNKFLTWLLYNYASHFVIALSSGVREDLIENFHIKKERVIVIYNPIDLENIRNLKDENIGDLIVNKEERIIIAVGKLGYQKDYPTLIKAFNIVQEKTNSKLIILGKGGEEDKLRMLCKDLKISDKVIFLGFKSNPYKYLSRADVFVLTSKWEGFGHVIVEAMAVGTPVIATDCKSGPSEIIGSNQYGILVPVGDYNTIAEKIIELLRNQEISEKYILSGEERAKDFDVVNIVKYYDQVFNDCIQKFDKRTK